MEHCCHSCLLEPLDPVEPHQNRPLRPGDPGVTRAQWAVLVRLDRVEGLKEAGMAAMLHLQPITLPRLLDRLCSNGLIERRSDPNDRRAKRLFLTAAARPVLERLGGVGRGLVISMLYRVS